MGHATVLLRYQSPQDNQWHESRLVIDAAEPAFYTVEQGQSLNVRVDKTDPDKITL
ncbi:hypothetical protein GTZ99_03930 [Novosphingobium sp. FSY-8]|uniref:Uncharacterized protein n=1 Tax=Novosphingobium ovatum TaxID=1908523 RepID=A0ABW9XB22_9SPHN|nr:hypothetical protein [Novosphingobium ovatum]NBC35702.1 hypothetical protein [Novosphingobium ovatum]